MVRALFSAALAAAVAGTAFAADTAKCTRDNHCPAETPCCGLYGDCGVGAFCLGGCDPTMSHSFDSCVPGPVCKSGKYPLDSLDDMESINTYLGDASKASWQAQGKPTIYTDSDGKNSTLLTMAEGTVGTLLASTHYVWYGKICTKASMAQGKGVVTAFILMSDVKDEIDFEWVGTDVDHAQSNYYSQGVTVYTNGKAIELEGKNAADEMHEYCIDWQEDSLEWLIDGKSQRTLQRKDTWNATSGSFNYPQTPSRIMLSLWPAGLPTNAKGTIEWAGGEIDWHSQYMDNGYYYARFQDLTVECYDPPSGAKVKGKKTYKYTDAAATNNTVAITDDSVVLGSLLGNGEEPGEASKSGSSKPTGSVAMVPGGNAGGGIRAEETGTVAGANSAEATGDGTFSQGKSAGSALEPGLGRIGSSAIAIVAAIAGLIAL